MKTKRIVFMPFLLIVAFLFATFTSTARTGEIVKKKEMSRTFPVGKNDLLYIDNCYGTITVSHWNRSDAEISVVVESKASREASAVRNLDRVSIKLGKTGSRVSAVTSVASGWNGNSNNEHITINYTISIPSDMSIELDQKYGNIYLPGTNGGESNLTVKYGNIQAGSFTKALVVDAKYSDVRLKDLENVKMILGYSGETSFGNAKSAVIESKYSNIKSEGKIASLTIKKEYGNANLREVEKAIIDAKYSKFKIGAVSQEIMANALDYSTLEITELSPSFNRITMGARYGNVEIGISTTASFTLRANNMKYGSVKTSGLKETKSEITNKENYLKEINGGGRGLITLDGKSYSNITVKAR